MNDNDFLDEQDELENPEYWPPQKKIKTDEYNSSPISPILPLLHSPPPVHYVSGIATERSDGVVKEAEKPPSEKKSGERKRSHCRLKLHDIVVEGLGLHPDHTGLKWKNHRSFEVNWDKFIPYYQGRGKSSAKRENIINRFPRKENGFKRDVVAVPSSGYDAVYLMPIPDLEKRENSFEPPKKLCDPSSTLNILSSVPKNSSKPFSDESDVSELEILIDGDAVNVLTIPTLVRNQLFYIESFIKRMKSNPKFEMNDDDCINFDLLLRDESENKQNLLTINELQTFLKRFGPLVNSVHKVRSFINSGAVNWYHGNISRQESETILKLFYTGQVGCTCYLIRSTMISPQNNDSVFVVSYLKQKGSTVERCLTRCFVV
jgi:hypothetical protein